MKQGANATDIVNIKNQTLQGLNADEISDNLGISKKAVKSFMPKLTAANKKDIENSKVDASELVDSLSGSNEELVSTNEELTKLNEELSATNVDLVNKNEELIKVNEELTETLATLTE